MTKYYSWLTAAVIAVSLGGCTLTDTATLVVKTDAGVLSVIKVWAMVTLWIIV